ncbi:acyltransferase family protein [Rohdeia mirabilis]|uniref:acyltransferase family protein n=1 Tax=Rohdeia mirabilis TaxID=2528008 RepID=UPI003AF3D0B9
MPSTAVPEIGRSREAAPIPTTTDRRRPPAGTGFEDVAATPSAATPTGARDRRVLALDLLRFLAALAVVLFHYAFRGSAADGMTDIAYPRLASVAKYGHLGVELFFMISGFVILISASRGGLRHFVASRASRLYPAFWVCCALTALTAVAIGGERFQVTPLQFLWNLTMFNGFVGVEHVDGAYWSLVVEIRFYLLIGLLVALRQVHRVQWLVVAWLAAAALLDVERGSFVERNLALRFAPFFCGGMVAYLVHDRGLTAARVALYVASWGLALRNALARIPVLERAFGVEFEPAAIVIAVTLSFTVIALVALRRSGWMAAPRLAALGALTYPLYLLHQNIGFMLFNRFHERVEAHVLLVAVVAGMCALAFVIHRHVERPGGRLLRAWLERVLRARSTDGERRGAAPELVPAAPEPAPSPGPRSR